VSIYHRNLNELFSQNKKIEASDFINTTNIRTMIAVVPDYQVAQWNEGYEEHDYVVPKSSKYGS
jgi:hypothetical protein